MVDPIHYTGIMHDFSISISFYDIGSISLDNRLVTLPLSIDFMLEEDKYEILVRIRVSKELFILIESELARRYPCCLNSYFIYQHKHMIAE